MAFLAHAPGSSRPDFASRATHAGALDLDDTAVRVPCVCSIVGVEDGALEAPVLLVGVGVGARFLKATLSLGEAVGTVVQGAERPQHGARLFALKTGDATDVTVLLADSGDTFFSGDAAVVLDAVSPRR